MRAVRVECSIPSIEHDERVQVALQAVSWDYRGILDQIDGRLRVMCECITTDGNCPPPGFTVGGDNLSSHDPLPYPCGRSDLVSRADNERHRH